MTGPHTSSSCYGVMMVSGESSKRGRAALTSPACGYQWRLIYWGMDGLMQLSVSPQASHLWICFSTVWPSVAAAYQQTQMMQWEFLTLHEISVVKVDVLFFFLSLPDCMCSMAGWIGLNIGLIVLVWWAVKMIPSHNGRTLLSDRYIMEIDEESEK